MTVETEGQDDISTERGAATWWCSEPKGDPDGGCALGLGNDEALYFMPYGDGRWGFLLLQVVDGETVSEELAVFSDQERALRTHYLMESLLAPGGTRNPGGEGNG